jgi:hypothetical protein
MDLLLGEIATGANRGIWYAVAEAHGRDRFPQRGKLSNPAEQCCPVARWGEQGITLRKRIGIAASAAT